MSGNVNVIYVPNLAAFDPEPLVPGGSRPKVGDWVAQENGGGAEPQMVNRTGIGLPLTLLNFTSGITLDQAVLPSFTPGGGATFTGVLAAALLGEDGLAAVGELVDIDIELAAAVVSVTVGTGTIVSRVIAGNGARLRLLTAAGGLVSMTIVGTSATAYQLSVTAVRANARVALGSTFRTLTGTLP